MMHTAPEISVEMFACIVDARVLEKRDVCVQSLKRQWWKNNAGNKQQQFSSQYFSFSFHHFPIETTGWFSPVWVWGWQAVRGHWHWAPRRCPGFPAKFNLIGNRKCKRIVKKYPKIPALWKQSPGFWGTPWSLWPLLQDPYHTWWWGWWWWDWWTSLVVLFVQ